MRRSKGISPVIAVLLLIVIAVAAAVLAYVWITGYIGTLQNQAPAEQLEERIKIDAVEIDTTNAQIVIYVTNIGEVNVNITSAYVLTEDGTVVGGGSVTPEVVVEAGSTNSVVVPGLSPTALTSGERYTAKVVTDKGTEATYIFRAP